MKIDCQYLKTATFTVYLFFKLILCTRNDDRDNTVIKKVVQDVCAILKVMWTCNTAPTNKTAVSLCRSDQGGYADVTPTFQFRLSYKDTCLQGACD